MTTNGQDAILQAAQTSGAVIWVDGIEGRVTALSRREVVLTLGPGVEAVFDREAIRIVVG